MLNIKLNENSKIIFIGGRAKAKDIQELGLIKASVKEEQNV